MDMLTIYIFLSKATFFIADNAFIIVPHILNITQRPNYPQEVKVTLNMNDAITINGSFLATQNGILKAKFSL